ncbi:arginase family protein, partial [Candidatus Woesearchaeota archaeon]|nr:arginase family protein [Candidatus Woesearchaeota archaeon]
MDKSLFMPPFNFGALWEDYSEYEKSGVVVLPVPYDGTATYKKGTGEGPYAIIKASRDL